MSHAGSVRSWQIFIILVNFPLYSGLCRLLKYFNFFGKGVCLCAFTGSGIHKVTRMDPSSWGPVTHQSSPYTQGRVVKTKHVKFAPLLAVAIFQRISTRLGYVKSHFSVPCNDELCRHCQHDIEHEVQVVFQCYGLLLM